MDTLQAAFLLSKMEIFDEEISLRHEVAERYTSLLKDKVVIPIIKGYNGSAWAHFQLPRKLHKIFLVYQCIPIYPKQNRIPYSA